MITFTSIEDCKRAITSFLITSGSTLPAHVRDAMITAQSRPSPVDLMMQTLEALYAARDDLDDTAKLFIARLAEFVTPYGYHGIQDDGRGNKIQLAMMRDSGMEAPAGVAWPAPELDPAPLPDYAPPVQPALAEENALTMRPFDPATDQ